jgi:phage baseplate assembly protein V
MFKPSGQYEDIPIDPDALLRIGVVISVDLGAARCSVQIGDADEGAIETPDIRWGASRVGNTRIWSPPCVGEQVVVAFPAGELAAGVIISSIVSDHFPPAGNSAADVIAFADGTLVSYDASAHILSVAMPGGGNIQIETGGVTIDASDGVTINGAVTINGDVTVTGNITASDDVTASGKSLKSHKHGGVQAGSAQTGAPA